MHVSVVVLRFRMIMTGDKKKQDEIKKLRFTIDALKQPDPFAREQSLTQEVVEAIRWQAARTPLQVMGERERIMSELETEANNCWHVWLLAECHIHWLGFGPDNQKPRRENRRGHHTGSAW